MTNGFAQFATVAIAQIVQNHYWGEGSEWFWTFGQFIFVAVTLSFIWKQVKLQTEQTEIEAQSHVVQTVCTIQERWNSESMQLVRHNVCSRWTNNKDNFDGACEHIANFFEELGTFFKIGAIPKETLWDIWSWNVEYYWKIFEKGIAKERKECQETVFCEFEELFRAMRKISDEKSWPPVDEASVVKFVSREIKMTKACLDLLPSSQTKK
jgi:hypothetical protein